MIEIEGLARVPIEASGSWTSETKVTRSSGSVVSYQEYAWQGEMSALQPILVAWWLHDSAGLAYQKFWRSAAQTTINLRLSFFPYDWNQSDWVQVNAYQMVRFQASGIRHAVNSRELKRDPRKMVKVLLPNRFSTGALVDLAVVKLADPLYVTVLAVVKSDAEKARGRWRLKQSTWASLPPQFAFLKKGKCRGWVLFGPGEPPRG